MNENFSFIRARDYFENVWGLGWECVPLGGSFMLEYIVLAFLLYHGCSL
jgi:hypothetical protein